MGAPSTATFNGCHREQWSSRIRRAATCASTDIGSGCSASSIPAPTTLQSLPNSFASFFALPCETAHAMTVAAAQHGVATIMTGFGADDLFSEQPFHLADLLRGGKLLTAWREASSWGRARNCHAWALLGPFGFSSVLPAWYRM